MYLKKINFKAFKDYLKNPTDPFLEGNIYITDSVAKYFRFVRTPAAKGEHTVEILYGGTQHEYYSKRYMGDKQFSPNVSLNFMAYVVDGEMLYSASKALNELFPQIKADAKNVQLLSAAGEELEAYLDKTVDIEPDELLDPRYKRRAYESAVEEYVLGNSACGIIFCNFPNLLLNSDNVEMVNFLANPTGWGERYATMKEPLLFDNETAKFFLCIQHCIKQYVKEFEEHPNCFESQCKALMETINGSNSVHITIKANGQTNRIDYPVGLMQSREAFSHKSLPVWGVRKTKIDKFLTENYKDYDHQVIPLKLIANIRNGKGVTWTNPFFEEV